MQMPIRNDFEVVCTLQDIDNTRRHLAEMFVTVDHLLCSLNALKNVIGSIMHDYDLDHDDGTACPASAEAEYTGEFDGDELEDNEEWPLE